MIFSMMLQLPQGSRFVFRTKIKRRRGSLATNFREMIKTMREVKTSKI